MSTTIQILDLQAIKVDHSVQSRVATNPFYMKEFSDAMLRGDEFPPVITFFDGDVYWLADGFHRYGARKAIARADRNFEGIRAEVREGTKVDAIVFSAAANQKFSIARTREDKERAVMMLRALPEWRDVSSSMIVKHAGIRKEIVIDTTNKYFLEHPSERPDRIRTIDGRMVVPDNGGKEYYPSKPALKERKYATRTGAKRSQFRAKVGGKDIYLGTDREKAEACFAVLESAEVARKADRSAVEAQIVPIVAVMKARGIASVTIRMSRGIPVVEIGKE